MSREQIARDLERKFTREIEALYERETELMQLVLDLPTIGDILVRVVTGSVLTTAATVAGVTKPDGNPTEVYDMVVARIFAEAQRLRPTALQRAIDRHAQVAA